MLNNIITQKKPIKILLVTQNPICTYSNIGKTLNALFDIFDKKELCQLYTYPALPDIHKCNSYYQLSDLDILKACFRKKKGKILLDSDINSNNSMFESKNSQKAYQIGIKKGPLKIIMRDAMWSFCGWKSSNLYDWIEKEKPTHIFVLPGRFKFISKIALQLSKDFNLPLITYICDDFYFVKQSKSFWGIINGYCYKRQMDILLKKTSYCLTISEELSLAFKEKLSIDPMTVMTGTNYSIKASPSDFDSVDCVNYFGNINCGRYKSLYILGIILDQINSEYNLNIAFNIYTSESNKEAKNLFGKTKSIVIKSFVKGKEFESLFFNSKILVHVESFDPKDVDYVKHSVSTKIADSLASGIVLCAFGPENVSSILHLQRNGYPMVALSQEELYRKLKQVLFDKKYRIECATKGLEIAQKFHNSKKTSAAIRNYIINSPNQKNGGKHF